MNVWELPQFGIENLRSGNRPDPEPSLKEVVVKILAVSLNYRDLDLVLGRYNPNVQLPMVPLSDAVGTVVSVGSQVTRFRKGDRVITQFRQKWLDGVPTHESVMATLGTPLAGVLAEYVVLHEEGALAAPEYLSDAEASTLPIAAVTAWFALVNDGPLEQRQVVFTPGTGGVSLFAAQIALAHGARVIVSSGSDAKLERARKLGPVECINYKSTPEWEKEVMRMTSGRGADHVLELVGGANLQRSIDALATCGHVAVIGFLEGKNSAVSMLPVIRKLARIQGVAVGHRRAFEEMNRFFEQHRIHPVIDAVYPFAEAAKAFRHQQEGPFGKIVIHM